MKKIKIIDVTLVITTLVCALSIVPGIVMWDKLPDLMATHFDINGTPNGYMSKASAVFSLPILMIFSNIVMNISYKLSSQPVHKMLKFSFSWIIPIVTAVVCSSTYLYNLGIEHNIIFVAELLLAFIFIMMGNYIPKTPDDLINIPGIAKNDNSEETINLKRRIARQLGISMVITGFAILITSFTPIYKISFTVILILEILFSFIIILKK